MSTALETINTGDAIGADLLKQLWRAVDAAKLGTFDGGACVLEATVDLALARAPLSDHARAVLGIPVAVRRDTPNDELSKVIHSADRSIASDIHDAERQRMQWALHDTQERTTLAVEAAQVGIYEWTPGSDHAIWSDIMRRLYGAPADEEITLAKGLAYLHPDDVESTRQAVAAALDPAGDGGYEIEQRTLHDGEVHWIASKGRVRFEQRDGRRVPLRLVGVAVDITARKKMEAEMRKESRRKDEFLAMLGHELRNPLAPLQTACELMRCGELEPYQLFAMQEMIQRQVAHMARLVDDLMDTARIGQGKLLLTRTPVELRSLIAAALEAARSFTAPRQHHVELAATLEPLWVDGDPVRLTQIVSNLVHNAVKFSADGGRIRVGLESDGSHAVIRVSDDGKGIPPEFLPHVFELFKQGAATLQREKTGLGLGLALVRNLVQMHGGSVAAASDGPGRGAEFVVSLPRIEAPAKPPSGEAAAGGPAPSRRVLVVDDNRDAAESLQMLLEIGGHVVKTAGTGEEAVAMAQVWAPELMLIDIGLPDIDGYEVARRLRARRSCRDVVLVALTGYGGTEDRQRSLDEGFNRHLVKPVVPAELLKLVTNLA